MTKRKFLSSFYHIKVYIKVKIIGSLSHSFLHNIQNNADFIHTNVINFGSFLFLLGFCGNYYKKVIKKFEMRKTFLRGFKLQKKLCKALSLLALFTFRIFSW